LIMTSVRERRDVALENLALRQQLGVLKRKKGVPRLKEKDRVFWVVLSRIWPAWREAMHLVKVDTVVSWQRKAFRIYWARISQRKSGGRPQASSDVRGLIKQMATANPYWGAPRIHRELLKLGIEISERTVSRQIPKYRKPPSQTWRAFLNNHVRDLVSVDFFTVPTVSFRVLFVFVVLAHHRRRIVHFNVTEHPTAGWTGQQMVEAFPEDTAPRYLLRDRDKIYGYDFRERIQSMSIEEVLSAPASPWQRAYLERLIGSIRRDCLDHVIVVGEGHLRMILKSYLEYYHRSRTHLGLGKDTPEPRAIQPPEMGEIVELPQVGGLHHRYARRAA
jgi:putative transposase